jgi:hypothetical protein
VSWIKKIAEGIKGNEDFSDIKSSTIRDIINGNFLTKKFFQKQYILLLMIAFLLFMYIDNRYYCETQMIKVIEMKKKIQDVKYESLTISAELMELNRQSNIQNMVKEKGLNLVETNIPPVVIKDSTETKE